MWLFSQICLRGRVGKWDLINKNEVFIKAFIRPSYFLLGMDNIYNLMDSLLACESLLYCAGAAGAAGAAPVAGAGVAGADAAGFALVTTESTSA